MKKTELFREALCVLSMCIVMVFVSCEGMFPLDDGKSQGPDEPVTITLVDVASETATFEGHINIPVSDLSSLMVTLYYSDAEVFDINRALKVSLTSFEDVRNFTITLTDLECDTKYKYCMVVDVDSEKIYSEVFSFTTLQHPYSVQSDLNMEEAADLSLSASANCYIISEGGLYKFRTVRGNSLDPIVSASSASILWETYGTSTAPEFCDLIAGVCYKDGYIAFQTSNLYKEGNAVIAVKDVEDKVLWSWHIWFTDQPQPQVYYNEAGTLMDRNLGATSATPGDLGALGLLYQWGRKDPFMSSSTLFFNNIAISTIKWPLTVPSDQTNGTIEYAVANPTTFIAFNDSNYDWYYTGSLLTDNTRWTTSDEVKSIYDPCPTGWRVPDGGSDGVWLKTAGPMTSYSFTYPYSADGGMNFSGQFGDCQTIWYPASGFLYSGEYIMDVGYGGHYWTASSSLSTQEYACYMYLNYQNNAYPSNFNYRAYGCSVRCAQE